MAIDIRIHINLSERQKRIMRVAVVAGTVIAASGIGIALATPIDTSWISNGTVLSATSLKGDFDGLQTQIAALQGSAFNSYFASFTGTQTTFSENQGWVDIPGASVTFMTSASSTSALLLATGAMTATTSSTTTPANCFIQFVVDATGNAQTYVSIPANNGTISPTVPAESFALQSAVTLAAGNHVIKLQVQATGSNSATCVFTPPYNLAQLRVDTFSRP
jgi:hypothetical protein